MPNQGEHFSWLANLPLQVQSIADFGCWSGCEPFSLLWTLGAHEIFVVDIEEKSLSDFHEQLEIITKVHPASLFGRTIQSPCRDMTLPIPELPDLHFDLAYCEDTLYSVLIQGGESAVNRGIAQMVRALGPHGLLVAVEPKFGAEFEMRKSTSGIPISIPVRISDSIDMSGYFVSIGLVALAVPGSPDHAYIYRKQN